VADKISGRSGTLIIPDKPEHTHRVPGPSPPQARENENIEEACNFSCQIPVLAQKTIPPFKSSG
jgi:hypothetical protein